MTARARLVGRDEDGPGHGMAKQASVSRRPSGISEA